MKLILVNPVVPSRPGLAQNFRNRHPPLSLALLATLTPRDWEIVVQDENYEQAKIIEDADLVGITVFTSQATRAYELADQYRARGIPVVIGGIHAWARPEEVLEHADSIVIGEAESVWCKVCTDAESNQLRQRCAGIRYDKFAVPDRSILRPEYPVDSMQTSRGCPENCYFCSVHDFSGCTYRRQSLDRVEQDLQNVKSPYVFVVDDNFQGFTPKHTQDAIAILKVMALYKKEFIIQAPMSICENDSLLTAAAEAGVRAIFIGLETGDAEGLTLINKRQNLKHGFNFSRIHAAGIGIIGSFVCGLDTDTPAKLRERARFMIECGCDSLQITVVTPLPGTRMFNNLQANGRLFYTDLPRDWDRYDFTELVYLPRGFHCEAEFYNVMVEVVEDVFSDSNIKMMAQRTYDITQNKSVVTFTHFLNYSYREIIWAKARTWKAISQKVQN